MDWVCAGGAGSIPDHAKAYLQSGAWDICRRFHPGLPVFEKRGDGRWTQPLRHKRPAAVLLSVCGFFEESAFGALSHYANFLWGKRLIAEIYRPAAMAMTQLPGDKLNDVLDATRQAGRELVESMRISPETTARITQPLGHFEALAGAGNLMWKTCIAERVTPRVFEQRGMMPRPDSVETFMMLMPMGFNPQAAGDTRAILQFTFSGTVEGAHPEVSPELVEGSCYFTTQDGTIAATLGPAENPDLTIRAPFEAWMDIVTGKADGGQMLMEGKYSAAGDISLLMKMGQWFSKVSSTEAESQTEEIREEDVVQSLTCREVIAGMPTVFNAEAAGDLVAVIYYKVTDEEPGDYYLEIANGTCAFHEGTPASPKLTIETPSEVWVAIATGELDGQRAFMQQKFKASGDFGLLMKLASLFTAG